MSTNVFYIKSLDGIRAVAVMLVFVSHAGFHNLVPGGFGVTIFFFLSGFLITTLLRIEFEKTKNISYKNFYLRRIYRIFPPLYIVLILVIGLSFSGVLSHDMNFGAVMSQFFQLTNYYAIFIDNTHFVPNTSVLWSLAVEEHFYFIFPIVFLAMMKNMSYRKIAMTLIIFCVFVLIWRCYLVYELNILQPHTYKATDTRIDSIMYGCIMGVYINPVLDKGVIKSEKVKVSILFFSFSILLFCLLYRNTQFRETFRYTLQGLALFPVFYLAVSRPNWYIFKWLNMKSVRFIGVISYTFYLSHLTFLLLVDKYISDSVTSRILGGFILTFMYFCVEKKFSALRKKLHSELEFESII